MNYSGIIGFTSERWRTTKYEHAGACTTDRCGPPSFLEGRTGDIVNGPKFRFYKLEHCRPSLIRAPHRKDPAFKCDFVGGRPRTDNKPTDGRLDRRRVKIRECEDKAKLATWPTWPTCPLATPTCWLSLAWMLAYK